MDVLCGVTSDPSARTLREVRPLPIDPATDSVRVTSSGGVISLVTPINIYFTGDASGWEHTSPIAPTTSVTAIYTSLDPAAAAPRYMQVFQGNVEPSLGDFPLLQSPILVPLGGVWQWLPPGSVDNTMGFIVVASTTQYTYTNIGALLKEIRTVAFGTP